MRKFFDSRRELVSSGPGSGGGGSSSGSSHAGGNFIGKSFTVGRHQVTVEEIIAEGENFPFPPPPLFLNVMRILLISECIYACAARESRDKAGTDGAVSLMSKNLTEGSLLSLEKRVCDSERCAVTLHCIDAAVI